MAPEWLDRLERRFGFLAIPGPASFLAGMNAAVGALTFLKPEFPTMLMLDPEMIRRGQVWRLATFVIVPPSLEPLWLLFWLLLAFSCLKTLENAWGDFRLTVFAGVGAAATAAAAMAAGIPVANSAWQTSVFLAFARLFPNMELLVFFFLPMKVKWLGRLTWAFLILQWLAVDWTGKTFILAGVSNYLLFFGPGNWQDFRFYWRRRHLG